MSRKLISLFLSISLAFCCFTPAFADTAAAPETETQTADQQVQPETPNTESVATDTETEADAAALAEAVPGDQEQAAGSDVTTDPATQTPAEAIVPEPVEEVETEEEKEAREAKEKEELYRNALALYIRKINGKWNVKKSRILAQRFIDAGEKYDLDPAVLMAVAQRESRFRASARSRYGYKGMMQTNDYLAKLYGYKPSQLYEAKVSIDVASRYLGKLKKNFKTYTKALSAYVYGGPRVKSGRYSTKHAKRILNTRNTIRDHVEEYTVKYA